MLSKKRGEFFENRTNACTRLIVYLVCWEREASSETGKDYGKKDQPEPKTTEWR